MNLHRREGYITHATGEQKDPANASPNIGGFPPEGVLVHAEQGEQESTPDTGCHSSRRARALSEVATVSAARKWNTMKKKKRTWLRTSPI